MYKVIGSLSNRFVNRGTSECPAPARPDHNMMIVFCTMEPV